jgi:phage-related protein
MAGPSIVVRILGDVKGLGQALGDAGDKAQKGAQKAHAAFSSFLGNINKTGVLGPFGLALDGVDQAIGAIVDHGKSVGPMMAGVGAGITALGATLSTFGSKEQASHQQLQQAIKNTGKSYDDYAGRIENTIKKQENYGHTAEQTQDALRVLTQATHDPAKALELIGTASDVAAAKHIDLTDAATKMGKVYNGNTRLLKEFGLAAGTTAKTATKGLETATKEATRADDAAAAAKQNLADLQARLSGKTQLTVSDQIALRKAQEKVTDTALAQQAAHEKLAAAADASHKAVGNQADTMARLADVTKGQAAAAADTFGGKMDAVKAKITDAVSMYGQKYGPAIQMIGVAVMALGSIWTMVDAMEWSALWPVLAVAAAVAALIVIGVILYKNWGTIWAAMHDAVNFVWSIIQDVWHWIANNWPLLLAILFGPVGIAAALIVTNFGTIKSAAGDAVRFIVSVWNGLVGFFYGIVSAIGGFFAGLWGGVVGSANAAIGAVEGAWSGVVSWVAGLGGSIANAALHIWDGIMAPFRAVVNGIANIWNSTVGQLHFDVPGWIPGIGGKGWNAPTIPTFQTGGVMPYTGLALLHAGETVLPTQNGPIGPAVVIHNVNLSTELDVDAFGRKLSWTLQTAGV